MKRNKLFISSFVLLILLFLYHICGVYLQDLYLFIHYPAFTHIPLIRNLTPAHPSLQKYPLSDCSLQPINYNIFKYNHLKKKRYLIAANFRNNENVLPTISQEILQLIKFLGPSQVDVSIYENDSTDKSREILLSLENAINEINGTSYFQLSDEKSNYKNQNRIKILSTLRNLAISPIFHSSELYDYVIFMNDVFFCADDVLELLHQHVFQKSHITCGMDYWKPKLAYYDTWVGRSMTGNLMIEFIFNKIFPHDHRDKMRFMKALPTQVFSCWNGMAILDATPFYKNKVKFRSANENECSASECQLLAKDFWAEGFGRVLLVPYIGFVYAKEYHNAVRRLRWSLSQISNEAAATESESVTWIYPGPQYVVCFPLEGINNPQTNWNNPIWEVMSYAPIPQ